MLEQKHDLLEKGVKWLKHAGIKSLYNVLDNIDLDVGVRIVNNCSHGILKPNIILLGYKNDWFADQDVQTYLNVLKYVNFKYGFLYTCNFKKMSGKSWNFKTKKIRSNPANSS